MVTRVQKWGSSQGLRLPKQILESADLYIGDQSGVNSQKGLIYEANFHAIRISVFPA